MDTPLDAVSVRVLGALVEKELATPDNYPLTLNALTAACNQTSNREPVMQLDETAVLAALDELTGRQLVRAVHRSDSRVRRYRHLLTETLSLHQEETAVLCVLLLRGPQTVGELRSRTSRLFEFRDLPHVEVTVQSLATLSTPLATQLPRQPGQKETRYAHLLAGPPDAPAAQATPHAPSQAWTAATATADTPAASATDPAGGAAPPDRMAALEAEVGGLRSELAELRQQFEEFRREFQ
jgi:uncharacterized protein